MIRPVWLRLFVAAVFTSVVFSGVRAGGQQGAPAPANPPNGQPAAGAQGAAPLAPPNPNAPAPVFQGPGVSPSNQNPSAAPSPSPDHQKATVRRGVRQSDIPAQRSYGAPRLPIVGAKVDTDLSKPLTIERAIQIALQQADQIAIAQSQYDAAANQLIEARSTYYPQITPSFNWVDTHAPGPTVALANGQIVTEPENINQRTDGIVASQLIWDTGKREALVGSARRSMFAAQYGIGDSRQTVIYSTVIAYYTVLEDAELVRVQQENVQRTQITLQSIEAQLAVGNAAQSDTLQAKADYANAQVALLTAQNTYHLAQSSLKLTMGVQGPGIVTLADTNVPAPSLTGDARGLETYVQEAYADRLDVRAQQETVYAAGYNVRTALLNAGVTVQATAQEGYQLEPYSGENHSLNVTASYPLFDGGSTRAAIRVAKAQEEQQRRTLDALEQNVRTTVEQAYVTREQAREQIRSSQIAVQAGEVNYQAELEKQKNGLVNVVDVITAEGQLVTAQVNLVQSLYTFYMADAQLQRDVGANDPQYHPNVRPEGPAIIEKGVSRAKAGKAVASGRHADTTTVAAGAGSEPPAGAGKQ
jgi:outer membrane protein